MFRWSLHGNGRTIAPDVTRMFADFRARDGGRVSLLERVPDVADETARRKIFPAA